MFSRKLVVVSVVGVLLVSLFFAMWWAYEPPWSVDRLIISRKTTFIEEPLRPDGYPDYVEALNAQMSEGVTPENNAAVLLLRAMGPGEIDEDIRREFFDRLGIATVSATGRYFEDWDDYIKSIPTAELPQPPSGSMDSAETLLWLKQVEAGERPWSDTEFPHLAKWLDTNEGQLEMVVAASKLPRCYAPVIQSGKSRTLVGALTPLIVYTRDATRALMCRAMRRLGAGDVDGAWDDLMACRRLGRLVGQGPMCLDSLLGHAADWPAFDGQTIVIATAALTAAQWAKIQKEFDELAPFAPMADKIDLGERLHSLDMILELARVGPESLEMILGNPDNPLSGLSFRGIDWNIPLEMMNNWLDRCVAAAGLGDRKQRAAALASLKAELDTAAAAMKEPQNGIISIFSGKQASERNGEIFTDLIGPAVIAAFQAEARTQTNHDLLRVGVALAQYKVERGDYPEKLEELVPKYLRAIPADAFAGTPLVYVKRPDGYLVYSLGGNQIDEGGKSYGLNGDDLPIEVPRKVKSKPTADG